MGIIENYWYGVARSAAAQFERIRATHRDSSVKGAGNEGIVAEFVAENTGARRVARNSAVIDCAGRRSDELDVVVVNDSQPIWTGDTAQLLLAEGVDAVYQVKAVLTTDELKRGIHNGESVKQLVRVLAPGSGARAITDEDGTRFVDHIPFFVFAFESRVSVRSALETLANESAPEIEHQVDGIFVLDSWSLVNIGSNDGELRTENLADRGFVEFAGTSSLASMLWCHHLFLHRRVDFVSPILQYWPGRISMLSDED